MGRVDDGRDGLDGGMALLDEGMDVGWDGGVVVDEGVLDLELWRLVVGVGSNGELVEVEARGNREVVGLGLEGHARLVGECRDMLLEGNKREECRNMGKEYRKEDGDDREIEVDRREVEVDRDWVVVGMVVGVVVFGLGRELLLVVGQPFSFLV